MRRFFSAAVILALLVSCGSPGYHPYEQAEEFNEVVKVDDKIDILFVVDNTYSMEPYQIALANSFDKFINEFSKRGLDFHVGVISNEILNTIDGTDTYLQNMAPDYWTGGTIPNVPYKVAGDLSNSKPHNIISPYVDFPNAGPGSLLGHKNAQGVLNPTILTADTPNLVKTFKENVMLGAKSVMAESGLSATVEAIRKDVKGGPNDGFFRPDAFLVIVMLSNEDDSIPVVRLRLQDNGGHDLWAEQSPHSYSSDPSIIAPEWNDAARYTNYKDASVKAFLSTVQGLKPGHPEKIHFTAIVIPSKADLPHGPHSVLAAYPGFLYSEVAASLNGETLNILNDWDKIAALGQKIVKTTTRFPLNQAIPDGKTMFVSFDGKTAIPHDGVNGWEFVYSPTDPTRPVAFELRGSAIPTTGNSKTIKIRFTASKAK